MLKSLISLFAEKFLQNKSKWIGSQANFSVSTPGTVFQVVHNSAQIYTPPEDGWITIGGTESCLNVGITGKIQSVVVNSQGYLRIFAPVRKGNSISIYCATKDQQPLEARFVPNQGSS